MLNKETCMDFLALTVVENQQHSECYSQLLIRLQENGTGSVKGNKHRNLEKIGAIIEQPNFYPYLSAAKNLKIVAEIKGTPYSEIDKVLSTVGLLERKDDPFRTFSLGMKQRLAIASALLNNPQVLILDEPTNGLDPEGIIQIRNIISDIAKKALPLLSPVTFWTKSKKYAVM